MVWKEGEKRKREGKGKGKGRTKEKWTILGDGKGNNIGIKTNYIISNLKKYL